MACAGLHMQNTNYTQSNLLEPLPLDGHEAYIYVSQPENLKLTISDKAIKNNFITSI